MPTGCVLLLSADFGEIITASPQPMLNKNNAVGRLSFTTAVLASGQSVLAIGSNNCFCALTLPGATARS